MLRSMLVMNFFEPADVDVYLPLSSKRSDVAKDQSTLQFGLSLGHKNSL